MLEGIHHDDLHKVSTILAVLVGIERRNEFILNSPEGFENRVLDTFGSSVRPWVELALERAKRMMFEADKEGKIYLETSNLARSDGSNRVFLDNRTFSPMTCKELALSIVLRQLTNAEEISTKEFLVAG